MKDLIQLAQERLLRRRALLRSGDRELAEIDSALARIAEGSYGRCVRCGASIGRHRLNALPESAQCLSCAA